MSWVGKSAALVGMILVLAGCKRSNPEPSRVDCKEDLDCYIARARGCLPTTVVHQGLCPLDWNPRTRPATMRAPERLYGRR